MSPVGFKPTISAGERPQTYALDRAATGTGYMLLPCLLYRANFNVREPAGLFYLELWRLAGSSGWNAARVLELFF